MATHRPVLLFVSLIVPLTILFPAAAPAQGPDKPDPEIAEQLDELKKAVPDRTMRYDAQAVGIIGSLREAHGKGLHKTDERKAVTAMGRVFVQGRARDAEHTHVYLAAAEYLGDCGELGARTLVRALESPRIKGREFAALRGEIVVNLGRTRDQRQIKLLLKLIRSSPDNDVLAAAGEALGYYTVAPLKTRRGIVKDILILYGGLDTKARDPHVVRGGLPQDFGRQNARERMEAVQPRWNATLSKLTGQDIRGYKDWNEWQKKNPNWKGPGDAE